MGNNQISLIINQFLYYQTVKFITEQQLLVGQRLLTVEASQSLSRPPILSRTSWDK